MLGDFQLGIDMLGASEGEEESASYAHGQSQARILQTYRAFGQSQADIKQTYTQVAQSQALLGNILNGFGQSQAAILAVYRAFGQSQSTILQVYRAFAQSQAEIRGLTQYGQSQAYIYRTERAFGQSNSWIEQTYNQFAQSQARIFRYEGYAQSQARIEAIYGNTGQSQAHILRILRWFAQSQALVRVVSLGHAQSGASIHRSQGFGQSQALIVATQAFGQSQAFILQYTDLFADAETYTFGLGTYIIRTELAGWARISSDPQPHGSSTPNGFLKFILENDYIVRIHTNEGGLSSHDTVLALYTGSSGPGNWNLIESDDDDGDGGESDLEEDFRAAGTYVLMVAMFSTSSSNTSVRTTIIISALPSVGLGQSQAFITAYQGRTGVAQSRAKIISLGNGYGQGYAQSRTQITKTMGHGQSQGWITSNTKPTKHGQSMAMIRYIYTQIGMSQAFIGKRAGYGQSQSRILAFDQRKYGQSQARILASVARYGLGQSQAVIRGPAFAQSQALIDGRYLVKYNGYHLPGYAQSEQLESIMRIEPNTSPYEPTDAAEEVGLSNKTITVVMKVIGSRYEEVKSQVELAATIMQSSRGFTKLYVGHIDRYYEAIAIKISTEKNVKDGMRTMTYTAEFEVKPWVISDTDEEDRWYL